MNAAEEAVEDFLTRFKLVCLKCGSDDVVYSAEGPWGSESMGEWPGVATFGCNGCKQNDFTLDMG